MRFHPKYVEAHFHINFICTGFKRGYYHIVDNGTDWYFIQNAQNGNWAVHTSLDQDSFLVHGVEIDQTLENLLTVEVSRGTRDGFISRFIPMLVRRYRSYKISSVYEFSS